MERTIGMDGNLHSKSVEEIELEDGEKVQEAVLIFRTKSLGYSEVDGSGTGSGGQSGSQGQITVHVRGGADLLDKLTVGHKYSIRVIEEDPFLSVGKAEKRKN